MGTGSGLNAGLRKMPTAPRTHSQRLNKGRRDDRAYDRGRRGDAAKRFRSSKRWQDMQALTLRRNPLCCDPFDHHHDDGVTVAATQVHHIEPLRKRMDLACVASNLAALCVACHNRVEARERGGQDTKGLFGKRREV